MAALEVNAQRKLQNEDCRAGEPAPLDSDAPKHSPSHPPRQSSWKGRKPEPQRRHGIKIGRGVSNTGKSWNFERARSVTHSLRTLTCRGREQQLTVDTRGVPGL